MLSQREKKIMSIIYDCCTSNNGKCLMSPWTIMEKLSKKDKFYEDEIIDIINRVSLDDYVEALPTEKKGELMYLFTLKTKGEAFKRELVMQRRALYNKLILSGVGALVAGVVAIILRTIFK